MTDDNGWAHWANLNEGEREEAADRLWAGLVGAVIDAGEDRTATLIRAVRSLTPADLAHLVALETLARAAPRV